MSTRLQRAALKLYPITVVLVSPLIVWAVWKSWKENKGK
jgi:hypothetical protein